MLRGGTSMDRFNGASLAQRTRTTRNLNGHLGRCEKFFRAPEARQPATLGLGITTVSVRGGRNVSAIATAPAPIADEAMNIQK
jgi:hypothetical protein